MEIALCDDNNQVLYFLKSQIVNYCKNNNVQLNINTYTNGHKLLKVRKQYDILFLDIEMDEINGIEIAKQIRKYDLNTKIVYVTAHTDYQNYAFSVHAFAYLIKPIQSKDIYKIMDELLLYIKNRINKPVLSFKIDSEILKLQIDNILYFECFDRKIKIVCKDNVYLCSYNLSYFKGKLKDYNFESPHKSFLVNMFYIKNIKGYDITMVNGCIIPISQKKSREFKSRLNDFLQDTFQIE